ncbi:MAG TPA: YciI family protein [Rhizomicrobium sp.]
MPWLAGLIAAVMLGALPAFAADAPPEMRVVVFHTAGPNWKTGVAFRDQPGIADHVAYYGKALADGKLSLGGPFLDNSGGMMIFVPGAKLEEIDAFAQNDPAVKSGLLTATVKPWYPPLQAHQAE